MTSMRQKLHATALREGFRYVERNPEENLLKLVHWLRTFARIPLHQDVLRQIEETWKEPTNNWRRLAERAFRQLAPQVRRRILESFLINAALFGVPKGHQLAEKYDCNVPWAILMDPTSNCNLNCTGCWAAEYRRGANLTCEELDDIIRQGKELGVYMYLYSGGEPLLRANDILKLARKHQDCMFCAFTNATLVDKTLSRQLAEVGNVALAISVEGFSEANDFRRGSGSYDHVIRAMDLLRSDGVLFGFSTCYHRENTEGVASEEFVDWMIAKGCLFGWFFTYIPLGTDACPKLLATPNQRALMYKKVREYRRNKDIFLLDFWNDGEYSGGCIAGGRRYLHINANGDVEPCAFVHYADANIRKMSLLQALQSPLFREYRQRQPFGHNPLRPCPLLDHPDALVSMVTRTQASSTQYGDREPVEVLAAKCRPVAQQWQYLADRLWEEGSKVSQQSEEVVL